MPYTVARAVKMAMAVLERDSVLEAAEDEADMLT